MYTELPALLSKSDDFNIDGLSKSLLAAAGDVEAQKKKILSNAVAQTYLSGASKDSPHLILAMTPDRVASMLADSMNLVDGKTHQARYLAYIESLRSDLKERYLEGLAVLTQ